MSVDILLAKFQREHPFTYLPPEVQGLVLESYRQGVSEGIIQTWTKEED